MSTCGVCLGEFDSTINDSQWRGHGLCIEIADVQDLGAQITNLHITAGYLEDELRECDGNVEGLKKELQELQDSSTKPPTNAERFY